MDIILKKDVDKLGQAGAVVKVKEGYARNFLIPNGLGLPVTSANLKMLELEKQKKNALQEKLKKDALALSERLKGLSLTIAALAQEEDKLYGSIGAHEISLALKDEGFEIDKSRILLKEPIKALGIFEVPVELHQEVEAKIKVWIVKK